MSNTEARTIGKEAKEAAGLQRLYIGGVWI
jgi:hypothetical protein